MATIPHIPGFSLAVFHDPAGLDCVANASPWCAEIIPSVGQGVLHHGSKPTLEAVAIADAELKH
jgi:hypothetical protein